MAVAVFATQTGMGIISPILPVYAQTLGASGVWIGFIAASYAISRAISLPGFGLLSDRHGRKIFLTTGLGASAALSFGYVFAPDVTSLTAVRFIHGVCSAMIIPIATAYIGDLAPEGQEGKWMGYNNTAFFLGFGAGPMLGGFVADHWGISVAFNAQGVMNLLAFLSILLFVPETMARKAKNRKLGGYSKMFGSGVLKGLLSYRVIYEMSMTAITTFLPIYCAIRLGMDKTQVGILIGVNLIGVSLLQIYTGRVTDRFNKRTLVTWGGLGTFVILALMTVANSFWMLLVLMGLRAVSSSFSMPAIAGLSVTQGRKFGMGSVQSIMGLATSAGDAIGPVAAGLVNDTWDVTTVFYFAAGVGVCGTVIFNWFTRDYVQAPRPVPVGETPGAPPAGTPPAH